MAGKLPGGGLACLGHGWEALLMDVPPMLNDLQKATA